MLLAADAWETELPNNILSPNVNQLFHICSSFSGTVAEIKDKIILKQQHIALLLSTPWKSGLFFKVLNKLKCFLQLHIAFKKKPV